MNTALFRHTPSVAVLDNRDLTIRDIEYYRHPDISEVTNERITHHQYDNGGNLTQVRHTPGTGSGYTTRITVSDRSNRGGTEHADGNPLRRRCAVHGGRAAATTPARAEPGLDAARRAAEGECAEDRNQYANAAGFVPSGPGTQDHGQR